MERGDRGSGSVEQQAADMLLMRPEAEADWDLEPAARRFPHRPLEYFAPEDTIGLAGGSWWTGVKAPEVIPTTVPEGNTGPRSVDFAAGTRRGAALGQSSRRVGHVYLRLTRLVVTRTAEPALPRLTRC